MVVTPGLKGKTFGVPSLSTLRPLDRRPVGFVGIDLMGRENGGAICGPQVDPPDSMRILTRLPQTFKSSRGSIIEGLKTYPNMGLTREGRDGNAHPTQMTNPSRRLEGSTHVTNTLAGALPMKQVVETRIRTCQVYETLTAWQSHEEYFQLRR